MLDIRVLGKAHELVFARRPVAASGPGEIRRCGRLRGVTLRLAYQGCFRNGPSLFFALRGVKPEVAGVAAK